MIHPGESLTPPRGTRLDGDTPAHWQTVRQVLNAHRFELAGLASRRYPAAPRVADTPLLCRQEWIPDRPLQLDEVKLHWADHAPAPAVEGTEPESAQVRPISPAGERYPTYADALGAIDSPALFDNRIGYRLLAAGLAGGTSSMNLGRARYFDGVSIGEAIAHELAQAWLAHPAAIPAGGLPLRDLAGDPCDLSRRAAIPAITTLTLRRGREGEASFLLHWRDPAKVTYAGGMYQAMPVGVFQPVDDTTESERNDLSLWRCMVREFSEELLGTTEDYSALGTPVDYGRWDFYQSLTAARQAARLNVACLGIGVDPLSLAVDILTVAVFDGDLFDTTFGGLVTTNAEGRVVSEHGVTGIPFTREAVARFAEGGEPMQAAGAAVLSLAWQHRAKLLNW
jgi:hypothetical protein